MPVRKYRSILLSNMDLIETGKIVSTHGIAGELRMEAWADSLDAMLKYKTFYLEDKAPLKVERARVHRGAVNLKISGIDSIDEAMPLIGRVVYIDRASLKLPKGSYLVRDLMGVTVTDVDSGEVYGDIIQVQATGANDVYHVKAKDGRLLLVPAIPHVVINVDIEGKIMKIRPLEGLFDM